MSRAARAQQEQEQVARVVVRPLDRPGDLGWVVMAHGEVYAAEFGWDTSFEALVARIVADYANGRDPAREAAWIAEVDGTRAGCVFCVHPAARGRGLGTRLVEECLEFARTAGYRRMTLWTDDVLVAARRIYQARGFELVEEERHHSFGHDLVGQSWARDL